MASGRQGCRQGACPCGRGEPLRWRNHAWSSFRSLGGCTAPHAGRQARQLQPGSAACARCLPQVAATSCPTPTRCPASLCATPWHSASRSTNFLPARTNLPSRSWTTPRRATLLEAASMHALVCPLGQHMLSCPGVRQVQKELGLHFMPPEQTYIDFATTLIQRGVATPVPK